jgi:N-dimethylarginine dimethylaminohydrolase
MPAQVISKVEELERLNPAQLPARPEPERVLMCEVDYFDVVDVKNPYMEGNIGAVDKARAREQWERLRRAFEEAGHEVVTIASVKGLEDMVFAANQVLPGMSRDGTPYVLLSRMCHASRQREVPYYRAWFERRGYKVYELADESDRFEGQGDAIWHPGKQLLWGGYGQRTSINAYRHISEVIDAPVIALELIDPCFYHLDTCFCVLREDAVMVFPGAFTREGREIIARIFPRVLEVSRREATDYFACNAHALDGKTVIMQRGAREAVSRLGALGFRVVEVDTGEFLKSGGSVFCLKMMIY